MKARGSNGVGSLLASAGVPGVQRCWDEYGIDHALATIKFRNNGQPLDDSLVGVSCFINDLDTVLSS
ncbi:hypothetical protein V1477_011277 [Vespula maculifrons]|uniref:Uncharacterized protein n=4 Tax=Vespula TaxID=7451 RepID=A0A834NI93_VESGE|nr:hypothetical protein HZH66_003889 [Vespula vulgaris]KAF7410000.1 hypothetical protein HZH68_004381 [Vespula germanica]KAF7431804.1 hypothetical protein H0235_004728 [Vespula pensylvanica]